MFIVDMKERTARAIWKSPEQRERSRGRLNMAGRIDQALRKG